MNTTNTQDGTHIYYKDWGNGQPIVFSHGWPLSADAFEDHMFFMTQQVIPQMKQQHSGHVVNISAALADQPAAGLPAFLAILSKSPTPAVSKALALEFAADNIRFNTVSPGVVNTPMHANSDHAALAKFHPLNRIAETSDIADAVLYLQNATFVTGENIHVDGGFHAGR
jgi:NAD(P)-dependent dehydrogenase (short-subunit alcohol dehydrogenase family)